MHNVQSTMSGRIAKPYRRRDSRVHVSPPSNIPDKFGMFDMIDVFDKLNISDIFDNVSDIF